ncbi:MAG: sodium:proton antiporter [Thermodesulfobacteriota bacterium]
MELFQIIALLLTVAALFSFLNYRFIKLPTTIGLMVIGLLTSVLLVVIGTFMPSVETWAVRFLETIKFDQTLLHGMLSVLLFAGALHVNINDLRSQYRIISLLATVGVVCSTFLVGSISWLLFNWLGFDISYLYCLIFGALISPTDPVAVLGILKSAGVPKSLETKIIGESLFNDGIGVVLFLVLLTIATSGAGMDSGDIVVFFIKETGGGAVLGLVAGMAAYWLLKQVDSYQVEVLITLALATGGYALAEALHLSAPIAIVVAGLLIGNRGRSLAMSAQTTEHLDSFWELLDEIMNAVLFMLIGLEVLVLDVTLLKFAAAALAVPLVLMCRFISVSGPVVALQKFKDFSPHVVKILTWGGLRGGISVALALSLPAGETREILLVITYGVVAFSIVGQGLSLRPMLKRMAS